MKHLLNKIIIAILSLVVTQSSYGWGSIYEHLPAGGQTDDYYNAVDRDTEDAARSAAIGRCTNDMKAERDCALIRNFENVCVSIFRDSMLNGVRHYIRSAPTTVANARTTAINSAREQCEDRKSSGAVCAERLTVCDGENAYLTPPPVTTPITSSPSSSSSSNGLVLAGGGVAAVGALWWFFSSKKKRTYEITVGYNLTKTDDELSYNFGGQVDYAGENWNVNIAANHAVIDNSFSGLEYKTTGNYYGDLFNLSFSEKAQEGKTDYDIVFSKEFEHGNLKLSPTYRMQSVWNYAGNGLKTDTANSLKLNSVLTYENWLINPSAGLHWDSFNFGDNQIEFRVMAVHKF